MSDGVYQALHEGEIEPNWVIGTSIGAVNGAIIAGNEPGNDLINFPRFGPIERPTKFELVINMKAAKALGVLCAISGLMQCSKSSVFDHLVGAGEQRTRNFHAALADYQQ